MVSRCGRSLNGYLCDFNVYTGATGERETCLGEKVVLTLSESIQGKHHQLFYDNYFFSLPLLEKLLSRDTYACGTIRTNRKNFPSEISNEAKKFSRGESVLHQSGQISVCAWKDNKVVNVATMLASPTDTTTVKRTRKDGTRLDVTFRCALHCTTGIWVVSTIMISSEAVTMFVLRT